SLRAHAVVSRGWLLAQLVQAGKQSSGPGVDDQTGAAQSHDAARGAAGAPLEIIRWYGRQNHSDFDVCADDHCQRYQGISKAFSPEAFSAVRDTRGRAMVWGGAVCDTRYSKSCGGMTEVYAAAWEARDVAYLAAVYDGAGDVTAYAVPLTDEPNAEAWIRGAPPPC